MLDGSSITAVIDVVGSPNMSYEYESIFLNFPCQYIFDAVESHATAAKHVC